ncbi:MAG: ATP-binding cassette subfamily F protein 3 [Candidatus Promineifilaceae bacterium]|jgi:ATP-binding cassette subfamily F protein 3
MSILSFNDLSQSFGAFDLFSGISGSIEHGSKIGLVGPNGVGKSTLLQILVDNASPKTGAINLAKETNIGYLRQEAMLAFKGREHFTVRQEMERIFVHLVELAAELETLEHQMGDNPSDLELLTRYSTLQQRYEIEGGYDYDQRIKRILDGLGFEPENWDTQLDHLSGGQKTRALLARLLLEEPDLLILDEPTNHLDIAAVEWLEGMLNSYDGSILIVSHDRYFLDTVATTVWEMSATEIEVYRGNYTAYANQREERWERRRKELEAEQAELEKEMDYIRKNIAGQRTSQAKGKWKRLNAKLGVDGQALVMWKTEEKVKQFLSQRVNSEQRAFNLQLKTVNRSGNIVLRTKDVAIGFPGATLFEADDIELMRLEVAALIGPNGCGKTTFLKTVLDSHPAISGHIVKGASLKVGYFSQAHDSLDHSNTILDELLRYKHMLVSEARAYLGRFMFSGDDVLKKVSTLSGGERGRLALSILALQDANFLLLDEPTNHLDITAQELLQAVLESFDGTILMVSHDRYLIDRLATQIWSISDGRLAVHTGSYREFLAKRDQDKIAEKEISIAQQPKKVELKPVKKAGLSKNKQRKIDEQIALIEASIAQVEAQLETITTELETVSVTGDYEKIQAVTHDYEATQANLEQLMIEWETFAD